MALAWSHGVEAYIHAREELNKLPRSVLAVIYAEWRTYQHDPDTFSNKKYDRAFAWASDEDNIAIDDLRDQIWDWAQKLALCENGASDAYMCPYGCMNHQVSMGEED